MEIISNKSTNVFIFSNEHVNKKNPSKNSVSLDLNSKRSKKSKSITKNIKTVKNFLCKKDKIIFKSAYDHKGAKKFLAEKEKAMEEFILIDELPDNENKKNIAHSHDRRKTQKKKKHKNKIFIQFGSENAVFRIALDNHNNKILYNLDEKNNYKIISDKNIKRYLNGNNIYFSKTNENKKFSTTSIKNQYVNNKEQSYLLTGENDSLIDSLINEMTKCKN